MQTLIRAASLTHFVDVARSVGLDPLRLLADVGLGPDVLREPDLHISSERVTELLERAAAQSGCESFGLRMAESRQAGNQLGNLGPVGLLIRDQPTLRDSLNVLLRYYQPLFSGAMSLGIEESAGVVVIHVDLVVGKVQPLRQAIELTVGVMLSVLRQFLGARWQPRRICFTHVAPQDIATHLRVFGPCVEFRHDFNGIVCARQDLDTPNPSADPAMARYAQQLLELTLREQHDASMLDDVRRTALLLLPSGRCSIEQVAQHLGIVCRTVQRRLSEQGTSFSDVVNELRVELAERHVLGSDRPLTEVAALLGFSAPSGFSRWYTGQFGRSPSQARAAGRSAKA
ncbi:AraC family transcriptional regulator [Roseateles violae]|uniref:AraC family transcriptional regulator n=1 Tax=Roseateles violae TaxID=3058042 RepID=A0ABT8DZF7_9BURK|nr:AraC family transcriptional regulator [Pelomonas sp. PFR6]MDN3922944.1 AraC family transcriptional regulator [Pelomonas sp. PFR6]